MKIDVNAIEGFDAMSDEEKVKALLGFEIEAPAPKDNADEVTKLKTALSKANSEAADWKRQLREKQTEQERAEAERAERDKERDELIATLQRKETVSGYLANCLSLGYDKDLATEAANAMADNDAAKIFECQQKFLEAKTKELEAAALNKQPGLTAGAPPTAKDAEINEENKYRRWAGLPPLK